MNLVFPGLTLFKSLHSSTICASLLSVTIISLSHIFWYLLPTSSHIFFPYLYWNKQTSIIQVYRKYTTDNTNSLNLQTKTAEILSFWGFCYWLYPHIIVHKIHNKWWYYLLCDIRFKDDVIDVIRDTIDQFMHRIYWNKSITINRYPKLFFFVLQEPGILELILKGA